MASRPTLAIFSVKQLLRLCWLLTLGALSGGCAGAPTLPTHSAVADFSFTDQDGGTVRKHDLDDKVWVADFFFTRCSGPCPQVSASMARLQKDLAGEKEFRLVSVTVDPEHDTPEVLRQYGQRFGANHERWLFLTGKEATLHSWITESFKLGVEKNEGSARTPGNEVIHSTRLALVDRQGRVRGYFDGRQVDENGQPVDELPKLEQAVRDLLREK